MYEIKSTTHSGHTLLDRDGNRMVYLTLEQAIKALEANPGQDKRIYKTG